MTREKCMPPKFTSLKGPGIRDIIYKHISKSMYILYCTEFKSTVYATLFTFYSHVHLLIVLYTNENVSVSTSSKIKIVMEGSFESLRFLLVKIDVTLKNAS